MLSLQCTYDATGSTDAFVTEAATGTIPAGDGATNIGISPFPNAVLIAYGAVVGAAAQALVGIGLKSNNLVDSVNGLVDGGSANPTYTRTTATEFLQLGYTKGPNFVQYSQKAAGKIIAFKLDYITAGLANVTGSFFPSTSSDGKTGFCQYSQDFAAATAGVYKSLAFAPLTTPPVGTYAVLGARVANVLFGGVLRFQHANFGGASPGFPVVSYDDQALTPAGIGGDVMTSDNIQGYQFVYLSQLIGKPCCPVFNIQGQGTGLTVQLLDTIADTVSLSLNLFKIA